MADSIFRHAQGCRLGETAPGVLRFGRVGTGRGDEVVAMITHDDPPEVEIHSHGGPAAVGLVVEALLSAGAELRRPVAWVRHSSASTIEAEAWVDLAQAPTVRTAEILLDQWHGALARDIAGIATPADAERVAARGEVGLRLISGWNVALAGRPNVGKSRLFNALAGYARAIVDPTPGTTRDVVTTRLAFDGWPVTLADTAGLREAMHPIETEGIARARQSHAEADVVLLVLDLSEPLTDDDHRLVADYPGALVVGNKADRPLVWSPETRCDACVSAEHAMGLGGLVATIARRLVPVVPEPGAGVPFRRRHLRMLGA